MKNNINWRVVQQPDRAKIKKEHMEKLQQLGIDPNLEIAKPFSFNELENYLREYMKRNNNE